MPFLLIPFQRRLPWFCLLFGFAGFVYGKCLGKALWAERAREASVRQFRVRNTHKHTDLTMKETHGQHTDRLTSLEVIKCVSKPRNRYFTCLSTIYWWPTTKCCRIKGQVNSCHPPKIWYLTSYLGNQMYSDCRVWIVHVCASWLSSIKKMVKGNSDLFLKHVYLNKVMFVNDRATGDLDFIFC